MRKENNFRNIGAGYLKSCSAACRSKDKDYILAQRSSAKGKIQSKETIQKRIKNTDQVKKQQTNKTTVIEKYGVNNVAQLSEIRNKISNICSGRKQPRASPLHQQKIIESKRKNGTLRHRKETKLRISEALLKIYQTEYSFSTIPVEGRGGYHKNGYYEGLYFRSSYEFAFIKFCKDNSISIECAANQKWRVPYVKNEKFHFYYPDFYLPQYDIIVEIKPLSRIIETCNVLKIQAAKNVYQSRYVVLTEKELVNLNEYFLP